MHPSIRLIVTSSLCLLSLVSDHVRAYAQPSEQTGLGAAAQSTATSTADVPATYATKFVEQPPRIDGILDPGFGESPAYHFTQYSPSPLAPSREKSSVWVGYDNAALYVVAVLYDSAPDSILNQLSERDRLRNTDWFGVSVNPYRDGINATNFIVTPAGVQYDSKFTAGTGGGSQVMQSGDASWDGVWASACAKTDFGWVAELRIPYSALRFPDEPVQTWDINFARQIRRFREESFWHPVNPEGAASTTQMGKLTGIANIKPPIRLQATPFVTAGGSYTYQPDPATQSEFGSSLGGGLDIKYGISDAFTLDMTAIPDFSNARSDDQVLNISANEIRFDENRAFFTEGVELFNKGGFFYSRRVGGQPINRSAADDALGANEVVIDNPSQTNLLNATKVSGRFQNGLGLGVFNAVEGPTFATIRDDSSNQQRRVQTAPTTNYSVVSLDQNLPNNSFVTLLNTNVLRSGSTYDANLSGLVFDLRNKSNSWGIGGSAAVSQKFGIRSAAASTEPGPTQRTNEFGHTYRIGISRLTGRLRYGANFGVESDTYDPNDLGFLFFPNERSTFGFMSYNWFEPFGKFNSAQVELFGGSNWLYNPSRYTGSFVGTSGRFTTRKFFTFGYSGFTELTPTLELQETRTPGRVLEYPTYAEVGGFISSDYRKPFALDVRPRWGRFHKDGRSQTRSVYISPRYRVNDALDLRVGGNFAHNLRYLGYVGHSQAGIERFDLVNAGTVYNQLDETSIGYDRVSSDRFVGSYRTFRTVELEATVAYSFTANMNLSLRARHYWSRVEHEEFFEAGADGQPIPTPYTGRTEDGTVIHDQTFNAFNVDLFYRWRFAPGSDAFLSYKTQSFYGGLQQDGYFGNLNALSNNVINNSLTLKVIYFIDAAMIGRKQGV